MNLVKILQTYLQIQGHTNYLTLFVPESIPQNWPEWLPLPLLGISTKEMLSMFARHSIEMYDSNNNKVKLKKNDSGLAVQCAYYFEPIIVYNFRYPLYSIQSNTIEKPTTLSISGPLCRSIK